MIELEVNQPSMVEDKQDFLIYTSTVMIVDDTQKSGQTHSVHEHIASSNRYGIWLLHSNSFVLPPPCLTDSPYDCLFSYYDCPVQNRTQQR